MWDVISSIFPESAIGMKPSIHLHTPLAWGQAAHFPLQHPLARREVLIGALWLLVPGIGWLLNMGHRIMMVHQMQHGQPAWPAWRDYPMLLRHGFLTFLGMVEYHLPATLLGYAAYHTQIDWLYLPAAGLWVLATLAVPGYMSHYCRELDPREIFDPWRALRRVREGGRAYWRAWGIALRALLLSFLGLLGLGIGFLWTSVWFWQVAGFSFATVFTQRFALDREPGAVGLLSPEDWQALPPEMTGKLVVVAEAEGWNVAKGTWERWNLVTRRSGGSSNRGVGS
ncbi:MAG: hypothetical protein D6722_07155 [Bacteroidetes bacterium]|nr:MAG: hypothetical protein D6722_07155 [Bacteroidota bacterium]